MSKIQKKNSSSTDKCVIILFEEITILSLRRDEKRLHKIKCNSTTRAVIGERKGDVTSGAIM